MISVSLEKDQSGKIRKVIVEGHALYNYDGGEFDIVCAGVSALTITLLNGFEEVLGIEEQAMDRKVGSGYTSFRIPEADDALLAVQINTLLRVYELGLRSMADAYGDYVTVIEKFGGE